ncbi:MAG: hypothetical protein M1837_000291 [Sclerophora amabilis]|nr:MAG: hypothetical protein M1837_000291 [Sclerophora amabilis]
MPAHPSEETPDNNQPSITEQVAQNPSSQTPSTASEHPGHQNQAQGGEAGEKIKAKAEDFQATPGPVLPGAEDAKGLGDKAGKDELRSRAAELNQK